MDKFKTISLKEQLNYTGNNSAYYFIKYYVYLGSLLTVTLQEWWLGRCGEKLSPQE